MKLRRLSNVVSETYRQTYHDETSSKCFSQIKKILSD